MGNKRKRRESFIQKINCLDGAAVTSLVKMHLLVMCIYFLFIVISALFCNRWPLVVTSVIWFSIYCFLIRNIHEKRTKLLYYLSQILTLFYIIFYVAAFGWRCSAHNFLFVMAALIIAANMQRRVYQILQVTALFAIRTALFLYTANVPPIFSVSPVNGAWIQTIGAMAVFADIVICVYAIAGRYAVMQKSLEEKTRRFSYIQERDPLTDLLNRHAAVLYLGEQLAERKPEDQICLALGDIDNFRKINDKFGLVCGDVIIKQLAYYFRKYIEDKGIAARWDGEEFLFVFHNMSGEDAYYYLTRMQQAVQAMEFRFHDEHIKVTMTYGLVECLPGKDTDTCLGEADRKLSMGKASGKNTIIY